MASNISYTINGFDFTFMVAGGEHFNAVLLKATDNPQFDNPEYIRALKIAYDMLKYIDAEQSIIENVTAYEVFKRDMWGLMHQRAFTLLLTNPYFPMPDRIQEIVDDLRLHGQHGKPSPVKVKTKDTSGYVYLLQSETGHYKIGRTKNPKHRYKTFGTKLPFKVEFIALIKSDDMYQLERDLHSMYAPQRIDGEWFDLTSDNVERIKSLAVQDE